MATGTSNRKRRLSIGSLGRPRPYQGEPIPEMFFLWAEDLERKGFDYHKAMDAIIANGTYFSALSDLRKKQKGKSLWVELGLSSSVEYPRLVNAGNLVLVQANNNNKEKKQDIAIPNNGALRRSKSIVDESTLKRLASGDDATSPLMDSDSSPLEESGDNLRRSDSGEMIRKSSSGSLKSVHSQSVIKANNGKRRRSIPTLDTTFAQTEEKQCKQVDTKVEEKYPEIKSASISQTDLPSSSLSSGSEKSMSIKVDEVESDVSHPPRSARSSIFGSVSVRSSKAKPWQVRSSVGRNGEYFGESKTPKGILLS